jgi:hypothetical protein
MRALLSVVLGLVLVACAHAPPLPPPRPLAPLPPEVKAVDRYGTVRFTAEDLRRALGEPFERYLLPQDEAENARLEALIDQRLRGLGFAWAKVSAIGYFEPAGMEFYVTIDVVEPEDVGRRMAFGKAPAATLPDVEGLVEAWSAYQAKGFELLRAKAIGPERRECGAFHCLFGFEHPDLARFGPLFARAPANRTALVHLLREAKDDRQRAAAAFLLAHLPDGREVVRLLTTRRSRCRSSRRSRRSTSPRPPTAIRRSR